MRPLILALDVTGHPPEWITWQEAITDQATDRVAREMGEYRGTFTGGISRTADAAGTITPTGIPLSPGGQAPRMNIVASYKFLRPNTLPVCSMSAWKAFKARVSELFRTSVVSQFALSVCLRAGYPSGAFTMGSQL